MKIRQSTGGSKLRAASTTDDRLRGTGVVAEVIGAGLYVVAGVTGVIKNALSYAREVMVPIVFPRRGEEVQSPAKENVTVLGPSKSADKDAAVAPIRQKEEPSVGASPRQ